MFVWLEFQLLVEYLYLFLCAFSDCLHGDEEGLMSDLQRRPRGQESLSVLLEDREKQVEDYISVPVRLRLQRPGRRPDGGLS